MIRSLQEFITRSLQILLEQKRSEIVKRKSAKTGSPIGMDRRVQASSWPGLGNGGGDDDRVEETPSPRASVLRGGNGARKRTEDELSRRSDGSSRGRGDRASSELDSAPRSSGVFSGNDAKGQGGSMASTFESSPQSRPEQQRSGRDKSHADSTPRSSALRGSDASGGNDAMASGIESSPLAEHRRSGGEKSQSGSTPRHRGDEARKQNEELPLHLQEHRSPQFRAKIELHLSLGKEYTLPSNRTANKYQYAMAAAAAAACCSVNTAVTMPPAAASPFFEANTPVHAVVAEPPAAATVASASYEAAPGMTVAAVAAPPSSYDQKRQDLRQQINGYLALKEPLRVRDDTTFRQIAIVIQQRRGTNIDFTHLSGEESLRQVLPPGTNFGRGRMGLYRAALCFFKDPHH
ncbi:hypothetical protein ACP70R_019688 [Stipagrostis hirtigluma subsp. patula]